MRSVYAKILGWSLVTLFISMTLVFVIGRQLDLHFFGAESLFLRLQKLELDLTVKGWEASGQTGVAGVISDFDRVMGWRNYVLDSRNSELATGIDRSALVARLNGHWGQPVPNQGSFLFGSRTPDRRYALIVDGQMSFTPWIILLFQGLILLTVAVLCWPLAFQSVRRFARSRRWLSALVRGTGDSRTVDAER